MNKKIKQHLKSPILDNIRKNYKIDNESRFIVFQVGLILTTLYLVCIIFSDTIGGKLGQMSVKQSNLTYSSTIGSK